MKRLLFLLLLLVGFPIEGARAQMQGIAVTVLQETAVSDTPDKVSITILATFEPGATTGWHTHPGDEYAVVLEGVLELRPRDGAPRTVGSGTAYHNARSIPHETVNVSDKPARITATFILDAGQPISIPWTGDH